MYVYIYIQLQIQNFLSRYTLVTKTYSRYKYNIIISDIYSL